MSVVNSSYFDIIRDWEIGFAPGNKFIFDKLKRNTGEKAFKQYFFPYELKEICSTFLSTHVIVPEVGNQNGFVIFRKLRPCTVH